MKDYKKLIDRELSLFFEKKLKQSQEVSGEAVELVEAAKKYVLAGGKRIRPILVILGYSAIKPLNEKTNKKIINASTAFELLHSFLLVHDDIMDCSRQRHGIKTIHEKYKEKYNFLFNKSLKADKSLKSKSVVSKSVNLKAVNFGNNIAICLGDVLYSYAIEVLADSGFNSKLKIKAMKWISKVLTNTCFGQIHDIFAGEKEYDEVGKKEIELIHKLKTSKYTLEGPLILGAILANASQSQLAELSKIAIPTGMAFQLQDDMLGLFSNNMGKDFAGDLKEKKKTMLMLKAMENGEAKQLLKLANKKTVTQKDVENIKQIIVDSSSLDYTKILVGNLIGQSKSLLKKSKIRLQAKKDLLELMDKILKRNK